MQLHPQRCEGEFSDPKEAAGDCWDRKEEQHASVSEMSVSNSVSMSLC